MNNKHIHSIFDLWTFDNSINNKYLWIYVTKSYILWYSFYPLLNYNITFILIELHFNDIIEIIFVVIAFINRCQPAATLIYPSPGSWIFNSNLLCKYLIIHLLLAPQVKHFVFVFDIFKGPENIYLLGLNLW